MSPCFLAHTAWQSHGVHGGENELHCWDCVGWRGRCTNGRVNKLASDEACTDFQQRKPLGPWKKWETEPQVEHEKGDFIEQR